MTRAVSIFLVSLLSLGALSCVKREQKTLLPTSAAQIPASDAGPFIVIGHLEHRDRVVTIKSGDQGLVYSVRNRDGRILFDNLTAEQLKSQSPEIHDFIEAGTAGYAGLEPRQPMNPQPTAPQSMKLIGR